MRPGPHLPAALASHSRRASAVLVGALLGLAAGCASPCTAPRCGAPPKRSTATSRPGLAPSPPPGATSRPAARPTPTATADAERGLQRHPAQVAMFRGDAARLGRSPQRLPRQAPLVRWRYATGRPLYASPVVDAAGGVYAASLDGSVYALNAAGQLRWRHRVGAPIFSTPALAAEGLVVAADDERVRLLDLHDGSLRWSARLGPCAKLPGQGMDRLRCQADGSPLLTGDGRVWLAADAIYAFELASGTPRARWPLPGHARASLTRAADGTLLVGTQANQVAAYDAQGRQRWRVDVRYHCDGTAPAAAGVAYVGCDDGLLRAFALADGQLRFEVRTYGVLHGAAAIDGQGRIAFGSGDGLLRVVDRDGKLVFSYRAGAGIYASPLVDASGALLFGARDGFLHALDPTGGLRWKVKLGGDIDSSAVLAADGTIYVGCDDGALYALR